MNPRVAHMPAGVSFLDILVPFRRATITRLQIEVAQRSELDNGLWRII